MKHHATSECRRERTSISLLQMFSPSDSASLLTVAETVDFIRFNCMLALSSAFDRVVGHRGSSSSISINLLTSGEFDISL